MEFKEKQQPFNRVIIVGNGFDIAYGLETRYSDFVLDYIKRNAIEAFKNGQVETELFRLQVNRFDSQKAIEFEEKIKKIKDVKELIDFLEKEIVFIYDDNSFFHELLNSYSLSRWVDIERLYYNRLLIYNRGGSLVTVNQLNSCMDKIKKALIDYLKRIQSEFVKYYSSKIWYDFYKTFHEPLDEKFADLIKRHKRINAPAEVLFLNFNYTNILENSLSNQSYTNGKHIYIHGSINENINPVILGYGDDTDENYRNLEARGEKEWLAGIKSFQYPQTKNYHNLLNFLSSGDFDVYIIGHSCGLSDRTLLKTIFEHDNCLAIKRYHYDGEREDFERRIEISRHFNDKIKMRERLLPFDLSDRIPQANSK